MRNLRFDRLEKDDDNLYNEERNTIPLENYDYKGFVKCKLIHSKGRSLIIPDLIYLITEGNDLEWIQFYSFVPSLLADFGDDIIGSLFVDIAFGNVLRLTITNNDFQYNLPDNSNLYACRIQGPRKLMDYTTGKGKIIEGIPYIYLYHHTKSEFKDLIYKGSYFKCSSWNYQGTRELQNFNYCYFTSLPQLLKPNDLKRVAMSIDEQLSLRLDKSGKILTIKVYRESTENRTDAIEMLIDSTILENKHIWERTMINGQVFYEFCNPFIYRIGALPGSKIYFNEGQIDRADNIKILKYIILGDASTVPGIQAPFDEETTESIFKIEEFPDNDTQILKYWFENANTDLYTRKEFEGIKMK